MNFGFSYIGLIFIAMLLIPNIIWTKHKPEGYDEYSKNENKVLLIFERIGEALVMTLLLIFKDCNIRPRSLWIGWLILTFVFMTMYEMYWARYFKSEKRMEDMYSSFAGFPVAGASLPVFAALSLGIYASNIFIIISVIILGIGHIGIHLAHRREVMGNEKRKIKKGRRVVRVIKTILLILVCLVVLLIIGIIAVRNYNFFACYIDTSKGVDESEYVEINGQEQFITIRGRDTSNPVILYLHGGPGSPDSSMTYTFTNELIDDYTVVCWDQRGCGRTYVRNESLDKENETVTFDQALADVDALTQYLKERFNQDKIVIMGHSYGSVLGSTYAYEHPENVEAYIGIGQFVSFASSTEYEYIDALEKANAAGDDTTKLTEAYEKNLREKTVESAGEMSKFAAPYHKAAREKSTILAALVSPTLSSEDVLWYKNVTSYDAFIKYCGNLMDYLMTVNLRESQPHYEVPVYFISGECDWNCAAPDMVDYAQMVGAKYDLIEGCGHYVHNDAPEEFANLVKDFVSNIDNEYSQPNIEDADVENTEEPSTEKTEELTTDTTEEQTTETTEESTTDSLKFEMVRGGSYIVPADFENITKEDYALHYVQEWENSDLDMYIMITDAMMSDIPMSLDEDYEQTLNGYSDSSDLPLNVKQEDGYLISGVNEEGIITYQKVKVYNERYVSIYITYPSSNSDTCNKIVEDFVANFIYE